MGAMISRRSCLHLMGGAFTGAALARGAQVSSAAAKGRLGLPGLFRGRVVAVANPASIVSGKYQADAIRAMMRKGMGELCGGTWVDAWRALFEPGDVVGIKVNPVGQPHVISDAAVVREIFDGLAQAGVKSKDVVLYDRYHDQIMQAGFDKWVPPETRVMWAAKDYEEIQQSMDGYDRDHYMEMSLVLPGQDPGSLAARRSYASLFIARHVNKVINLPVLKDHQSAGVTLALKNLSHGMVNNVSRSHGSFSLNACGSFIPAVVSMPVIREKVVLNILDGVKGLYHGGPGSKPQFVWEHRTLYFATDPVALDHIGWRVIDEKRVSAGMKLLVDDKPDQFSHFVHRQPEHVEIAGALGLGEWNLDKIDFRKV
jgi:uncharacterized protein (DUF362 family)